ncbi:MAG: ATP-binding protein, partial [Thermoanaerobaculia bacterium]|nr:ATP-binding protein [Thermoanaerobaculia bacterium]
MKTYEKLGSFYLGRPLGEDGETEPSPLLYDARDLTTHAVCVGMTGSGKTGLCISLLEEAALDAIPALAIDPKGDLGNLLLTFPELDAASFRPWVSEEEARRAGVDADAFARRQAELWRDGLAEWDQGPERIRRLREAAEFAIYTPGSAAGLPLSILASFAAPHDPEADRELYRERIGTTVTSLLTLLGVDADAVQSREHILLSNLLDHSWRRGLDLDLAALIHSIQKPPMDRIGVVDVDTFFPSSERFELAMRLNALLAAPAFQGWLEGEPLDVDRLLYTADGRPRLAVVSIAHLDDSERMFFVSLLLNEVVGWMRGRPGTSSLRARLYMDEIFGYMPPVAEPPSKRPLLTLLKQARAYGLGIVLATQNPVDLDYKGLSNTGTWFLGRLQTERDKQRVLDGLEGASGQTVFDRRRAERVLSGLGKRVFWLHSVHEPEPVLFRTRWAMSYLRGPLTREQIRRLCEPLRQSALTESDVDAGVTPASTAPVAGGTAAGSRPVLPPDVEQLFVRPVRWAERVVYRPAVLGRARVHFTNRGRTREGEQEVALLAPWGEESVPRWEDAEEVDATQLELSPHQPQPPLPVHAPHSLCSAQRASASRQLVGIQLQSAQAPSSG